MNTYPSSREKNGFTLVELGIVLVLVAILIAGALEGRLAKKTLAQIGNLGALAGFIAYSGNNLVLHAVAERHRAQGRAKYWWSAMCGELLALGHEEVKSSISADNLAVLNLYVSLGFSFSHPQDIYHRMTP